MKKLILSELLLLFLATTFISDNPPGWYQQSIPIGNKQITDIQFLDSLNGWVVTNWNPSFDTSYIFSSTDGGNSWIFQARYPASFNAISMVDFALGYAVGGTGNGRIYKTTNGGVNWYLMNIFASSFFDVQFINKDTGWICSPIGFGGLYKTINGGTNWQIQLNDTYSPKKLFFLNADTGWVISEDNKIYRTVNSGLNWLIQNNFGSEDLVDVFFTSKDTGWIHGGPSGLYKTTNSGFNWDTVSTPFGYGSGNIYFTDSKHGWIGRSFSRILVTSNGLTWGYQNTPTGNHYAVYFTDTLKGWAGGDNLIHTTDGGGPPQGIKQIGSEIPSDFRLYQNYPNPFNPSTIIRFQIQRLADVKLIVYDMTGKEITILTDKKYNAGKYEVDFDGSTYSSGVYFYSLVVEGKVIDTKRMVLVK